MTAGRGLRTRSYDVLVIGAGLAGLVSAARAAAEGARVGIVAASSGSLNLWSGQVGSGVPSSKAEPDATRFFLDFTTSAGLPYGLPASGRPAFTVLSASGRLRQCALLPITAAAGDVCGWGSDAVKRELLVVGFTELPDYPAGLISARASASAGVRAGHRSLSLGPVAGRGLPPRLAHLFDDRTWFGSFLELSSRVLAPDLRTASVIAFPPVLGLVHFQQNLAALEKAFERPVFELAALPPSVPGQRLWRFWRHKLESEGRTTFHLGRKVLGAEKDAGKCVAVHDAHNRYEAQAYVMATGGVAGGGLEVKPEDFFHLAAEPARDDGAVHLGEPLFGLLTRGRGQDWLSWGVKVDQDGRPYPVGESTEPLENVYVAGWQLGDRHPDAMLSIQSGVRAGLRAARLAGGRLERPAREAGPVGSEGNERR